jgi:hypothetical protein
VCGGSDFVWKSFVRGYNTIYMDPFDANPERESARLAMGRARALAARLPLHRLRPSVTLCSTHYCLARPGEEAVVYQPGDGEFSVMLGRRGSYRGEWLRPARAEAVAVRVEGSSGPTRFEAPWSGPAVLHLRRSP